MVDNDVNRRRFLAAVSSTAALATAGCQDSTSDKPSDGEQNNTTKDNGDQGNNDQTENSDPILQIDTEVLEPGQNYTVGVGNTDSATLYLNTSEGETIIQENIQDKEHGDGELTEINISYEDLIGNDKIIPGNHQIVLEENGNVQGSSEVSIPDIELDPVISTETEPEMGRKLILRASDKSKNTETFKWNIEGYGEQEGPEASVVPQGIGNLTINLTASGAFSQEKINEKIDIDLWDNIEMRLKQIDTHPKEYLVEGGGYPVTVVDEEIIRFLIDESAIENREKLYLQGKSITDLTDYENIKNRSYSMFSTESYEMKNIEKVIESASSKMDEVNNLDSIENQSLRFRGKLSPGDPHDAFDKEVEHEAFIFPDENLALLSRLEGYPRENQERFGSQYEEVSKLRAKATGNQIETLSDDLEGYTQSSLFNERGFLIDRIGMKPGFEIIPDDVDWTLGGGQPVSPDELEDHLSYRGFRVNPVIYNAEEDLPEHHIKGPMGEKEYLPSRKEIREYSIDQVRKDDMDILGKVDVF